MDRIDDTHPLDIEEVEHLTEHVFPSSKHTSFNLFSNPFSLLPFCLFFLNLILTIIIIVNFTSLIAESRSEREQRESSLLYLKNSLYYSDKPFEKLVSKPDALTFIKKSFEEEKKLLEKIKEERNDLITLLTKSTERKKGLEKLVNEGFNNFITKLNKQKNELKDEVKDWENALRTDLSEKISALKKTSKEVREVSIFLTNTLKKFSGVSGKKNSKDSKGDDGITKISYLEKRYKVESLKESVKEIVKLYKAAFVTALAQKVDPLDFSFLFCLLINRRLVSTGEEFNESILQRLVNEISITNLENINLENKELNVSLQNLLNEDGFDNPPAITLDLGKYEILESRIALFKKNCEFHRSIKIFYSVIIPCSFEVLSKDLDFTTNKFKKTWQESWALAELDLVKGLEVGETILEVIDLTKKSYLLKTFTSLRHSTFIETAEGNLLDLLKKSFKSLSIFIKLFIKSDIMESISIINKLVNEKLENIEKWKIQFNSGEPKSLADSFMLENVSNSLKSGLEELKDILDSVISNRYLINEDNFEKLNRVLVSSDQKIGFEIKRLLNKQKVYNFSAVLNKEKAVYNEVYLVFLEEITASFAYADRVYWDTHVFIREINKIAEMALKSE